MSNAGGPYGRGPRWPRPIRGGPGSTDYFLLAAGGILLAVSTVLPWINVAFVGGVDLFRWTKADDSVGLLPWLMVLAGIGLAVGAYRRVPLTSLALAGAVTAAVSVLVGAHDVYDIVRAVDRSQGLWAGVGSGIAVAAVAVVILAVAALRVHLRYRASTAPSGGRRAGWGRRSVVGRPRRARPITQSPPFDLAPGWKPDPWGVGNGQRYWDGRSWTSQTIYQP